MYETWDDLEGLSDPDAWAPEQGWLGGWSADDVFSPWGQDDEGLFGTPDKDAEFWQQQGTGFTCAVVSQKMILEQYGIDVTEAQLVYDATTNGWLTHHGTSPADMGRLLEYYGVPFHEATGVESLVADLAQGRKVIVAVDSGEMWNKDWFFEDWITPNGADHAIVVTGLDLRDPQDPKVFINDPGDPHGAGRAYPLAQFLEAWQDSGWNYLATDFSPSDLASHSLFGINFNSQLGMYMDPAFWLDWLLSVFSDLDKALFQSELTDAPPSIAAGATTTSTFDLSSLDRHWEQMDDEARNKLFLQI